MNFTAFKDLTRFGQTLFGLPFIIAAVVLTCTTHKISLNIKYLWIFPAFLAARIAGMSLNQLVDRRFDAKNPRTKNRALPSGRVTPEQARFVAISALLLFFLICLQINLLCFLFSFLAGALLVLYSYMKRIHASCHLVIAFIHLLGPVMTGIAILGHFSWQAFVLGLIPFFSIAGNDIVYAIQDYEFDLGHGLHSIPTRLGVPKSILVARGLHSLCLASLLLLGIICHFPFLYYLSIFVVGAVFFQFYSIFQKHYQKIGSLSGIEHIFFFNSVAVAFFVSIFVILSALWVAMF